MSNNASAPVPVESEQPTPPATPEAAKIYKEFCRKMAPGGPIDQILRGGRA